MTTEQIKRIETDFRRFAKVEPTDTFIVEQIGGAVYVFTGNGDRGEVLALRLFRTFCHMGDRVKADYSTNLSTFFFRSEFN